MNRDALLTIALLVVFPAFVTLHIATLFGLAKQRQLAAAVGGLIFPPLAPCVAFVRGMRVRAVAWIVAATVYGVVYLLAR